MQIKSTIVGTCNGHLPHTPSLVARARCVSTVLTLTYVFKRTYTGTMITMARLTTSKLIDL